MHDERDTARRLEEIHFVPESALAEHVAVIGEQQNDGIAGEARIGERAEQHADLIVHVGDRAVVGAARGAHLRLVSRAACPGRRRGASAASADRADRRLMLHARHVDVDALVAVPVASRGSTYGSCG